MGTATLLISGLSLPTLTHGAIFHKQHSGTSHLPYTSSPSDLLETISTCSPRHDPYSLFLSALAVFLKLIKAGVVFFTL
jgi:hypothetical protein